MKRLLVYATFGIFGLALTGLTGCSDENDSPTPTSIDQSSLSYEARPGAVKLKWEIPAEANYKYVKVTYTLPDDGKECMRLASVYSDTLIVDNLLRRYGELEYTLQPCNRDGKGGKVSTVKAQSLAAPIVRKEEKTKVLVDKNHIWTDSQELSEGPLENLVDGNVSTFFHMKWDAPEPLPHYIVMDTQKEMSSCQFSYNCRDHGNKDNPKTIEVWVSTEFNQDYDYTAVGAWKLATVSNLPAAKAAAYSSNVFESSKPFRYVWFKITETTTGKAWVALSEMSINKVKSSTFDPETGETITVD